MECRIEFYAKPSGASPVREYIGALDQDSGRALLQELELLAEYGPQMRDTRQVRGKIWELRKAHRGMQHRILYFVDKQRIVVLLIAFTKKTPKTPLRYIELAETYRNDHLCRTERT